MAGPGEPAGCGWWVSAILTAPGAALPCIAGAAVFAGAGYAGRRALRRGSRPKTAG